MAVVVDDAGEIIPSVLDLVTTIPDVCERFNVSRGLVINWMFKDAFEWRKQGRVILIDLESFARAYEQSHYRLDTDCTSK
jgi:hypothetical protein